MNCLSRSIFATAVLVTAMSPAPAAEPVFPPGSRVGLAPPPGMIASTTFQGFHDPRTRAMIAVTEASRETFTDIANEFSPAELRAGGMTEESRQDVALQGGRGFIVVASQQVMGAPLRKWALVAAIDDLTLVIVVLVPEAARQAYPDAVLRDALASVTVRARLPVEQQLALLPYRMGELAGFHVVRARPDGTALLSYGPKDTAVAEEQPFLLILTPAAEMPAAEEREAFARRALARAMDFKTMRYVSLTALRIGGEQGHEIVAEMTSTKTNTELTLVQWLRFRPSGPVQIIGVARRDAWETVIPLMRAVRDGIEAK